MHLVDRILVEKIRLEDDTTGTWDTLGKPMPTIRVVADDVAKLYSWSGRKTWDYSTDFGCLRPPYDSLWIEYQLPKWQYAHNPNEVFGAEMYEWTRCPQDVVFGCLVETAPKDIMVPGHIGFGMTFFEAYRHGNVVRRPFYVIMEIDTSGQFLDTGCGVHEQHHIPQHIAAAAATTLTHVPLLAISLMHCRNIQHRDEEPSAKLSKKWERRRGKPLSRISRIMLPAVNVPGGDPRSEGSQWKEPLHLVRGHFKTYTNDRPLMGRNVGRYWWPPHVRGSREHGERLPEYEIRTGT